ALLAMTLWMLRILHINLPAQMLLAVGPLLYFYVLNITQREHQYKRKDLLHLSPLAFAVAPAPVLQTLIFASVMAYLYLADRLIQKFYKGLQPVLMDRSLLEFRWLRRLLGATAMLWVLWIVSESGLPVYGSVYIFFAVMVIWTAAAAFLRPQAGVTIQTSAKPALTHPAELRAKGAWLKKAMEANRYYQDPELSLASLAEKLGLTTHELSRLINTVLKKSFNDFINEYRVRDVAAKMQDPAYSHITLLGIAYESGFNSKATFNRTFKQLTGKSPVEYKSHLKKEVSTYNLRRMPQFAAIISNHNATPKWSKQKLNRNYMFKNYFKVALRSMRKNIGFSVINIIGLSAGLAVCLLIVLYVKDELSFDTYNAQAENIYRLDTDISFNGTEFNSMFSEAPLAPTLKQDYPLVVQYVRLRDFGDILVRKGNQNIQDHNAVFADSTFFRVFSIPMVAGNKLTALNEPNSIVIDETTAKKYFNSTDVVGKTLYVDNHSSCKITGVFEDIPAQSHFHFRFIRSIVDIRRNDMGDWLSEVYASYVLVRPGVTQASLQKQVDAIVNNYLVKQALQVLHVSPDDIKKAGNHFTHPVIRVTDIHLHSNKTDEFEANG
ncbi:MAG: ABC transporter permease, partial [Bacteroidetes bacterium]|nr:ABC transporter permease [Bacteroidota bacterium]